MRKLAPMFVLTTLAALIGSTAGAATGTTMSMSNTDKNGSPTVDANTTATQNLSYSDKSNTSPGTNAKMDGAKMDGKAAITTKEMPQRTADFMDEDDKAMTAKAKADKMRKQKAKLAKAGDSKMMMNRTPAGATNDSAANSTTGVSQGQ